MVVIGFHWVPGHYGISLSTLWSCGCYRMSLPMHYKDSNLMGFHYLHYRGCGHYGISYYTIGFLVIIGFHYLHYRGCGHYGISLPTL